MSNMEKAFKEMQNLQEMLGAWSVDLNRFLRSISEQNRKLNQNWNDSRQQEYQRSWAVFEEQQQKNHKIGQDISVNLVQLCKYMSMYLKQPVMNMQIFERLNQVQGLTGWPASTQQPVEVRVLLPDIKDYKQILDHFRLGLKDHIHKILATIQRLEGYIRAPNIDACRDNVKIKVKQWIEDTEKSTHQLSSFIDAIYQDLSKI